MRATLPAGDAGAVQDGQPLRRRAPGEGPGQLVGQGGDVLHPQGVGQEEGVPGQLWRPDGLAEAGEEEVVPGGEGDVPLRRGEGGEGGDRRVPAAQGLRVLPAGPGPGDGVLHHRDHGVLHGDVQEGPPSAALPGVERRQDPGDAVQGGDEVAQGGPDAHGRAPFRAGEGHQPGDGLDDHVVGPFAGVGAVVPEAGDGAVDEARVAPGQVVVAQAEAGHRPRAEVLQQDVRPGAQVAGAPRPPPAP